jgi:hypothetical protein
MKNTVGLLSCLLVLTSLASIASVCAINKLPNHLTITEKVYDGTTLVWSENTIGLYVVEFRTGGFWSAILSEQGYQYLIDIAGTNTVKTPFQFVNGDYRIVVSSTPSGYSILFHNIA